MCHIVWVGYGSSCGSVCVFVCVCRGVIKFFSFQIQNVLRRYSRMSFPCVLVSKRGSRRFDSARLGCCRVDAMTTTMGEGSDERSS